MARSADALVVARRESGGFGITALGLNSDTAAHELRAAAGLGETDAPAGLRAALARSNRLQHLLLEEMVPGRSGSMVLERTLARMREEGLDGTVYTHPIGDHGHGAGLLIGLWDRQAGVPGRGAASAEHLVLHRAQVTSPVEDWGGQTVRMAQEAWLDGGGYRRWVLRRQEALHLIR